MKLSEEEKKEARKIIKTLTNCIQNDLIYYGKKQSWKLRRIFKYAIGRDYVKRKNEKEKNNV